MKRITFLFALIAFIPLSVFAKDYVIGDGDSLNISVWGNPEISIQTTVRPDGKISVPAIGEIVTSGLTPKELTDVLTKEIGKMLKTPIITVIVTKMTNYRIFVVGTGVTTGVHTLLRETTLLEFFANLGQLANADLVNSYLMRKKEIIKTNFTGLIKEGDLSQDIILQANDILFIPDNFENKINIVGAVNEPKSIPYRKGLTILDIILTAGGFNQFAKKNDVKIFRKNQGRKRVELTVRVNDLIKKGNMKENILIMPGDFVIVKERMF